MKQIDIEKIEKEEQGPLLEPEPNKPEETKSEEVKPPPPPKPEPSKPEPPKRGHGSFLPYFIGLLIGLVLVFGFIEGRAYLQSRKVEEIQPQESAITTETATPPAATEQTQTQETAPTPTLDKAGVSIQVLNGNGITGDAIKVKQVLEKDGFKVASVGNASSFAYQTTTVYYKEGKEEAGKAVEATIKAAGRETKLEKKTALTKYDAQVVVGKR